MGQNGYRVQLLAPAKAGRFVSGIITLEDAERYQHYLSSLQRLRAHSYLEDGAIEPWQIDDDGRFWMESDDASWHFLLLDEQDRTIACLRFLLHTNSVEFDQLRLTHSSIAKDPLWSGKLRAAVEADLAEARRAGIGYAELGGWAIAAEHRCTKAALETLLASYAWGQMVGGCLSSCTATVRHRSAMILRRVGGQSLCFNDEPIPAYEDPQYGCSMEILRFDSRVVDGRFARLVEQMREKLEASTVIRARRSIPEELSEELSFGQSLLALGAATRRNASQLDGQLDASNPLEPSDTARVI
jgi:hypothetical protein